MWCFVDLRAEHDEQQLVIVAELLARPAAQLNHAQHRQRLERLDGEDVHVQKGTRSTQSSEAENGIVFQTQK